MSFLDDASVAPEVRELRPDYAAFLVVARGIHGAPSDDDSDAALAAAEGQARELLAETPVEEIAQVAAWREAFRSFRVKPRSAVSSLEALLKRVDDGLPRIDRLTDHYNAISVSRLVPFGGEDLDAYVRAPRLVVATGEETFDAVERGEVVQTAPKPGEVVWRDDVGVTCRRWNWRQCARTRLTPETRHALYIIDGLGPTAAADAQGAGDDLVTLLRRVSPEVDIETRLLD